MLQRTGCSIARIRKQRKTCGFAFLVQFLEAGLVQISFATYLENVWRITAQLMRHRPDCFDVLRDIVPDKTVAASRGIFQPTLFVHQRHCNAIHFWLDHHRNSVVRQQAGYSFIKIRHFLFGISVVEAKHWRDVLDLRECFERFAAHALGGRIRRDEIRKLRL